GGGGGGGGRRRGRSPRRRGRPSSRTAGIRRRGTGSASRLTIAAGISQRILARLMPRRERLEHERALGTLARLYGIQRSYVDVRGRRIRASRDAVLATLAALDAPVTGVADLPGAIRERRRWAWERPLEPVIVAWDGRLEDVTIRVPVRRATASVSCRIELEGGDVPFDWRSPVQEIGRAEV